MEPYKKATDEILRRREQTGNIVKHGASIASSALSGAVTGAAVAGGASLFGKIMPLLSKYVPQEMAIKGISKINPTIGKAIQTALDQGYEMPEIEEFFASKNEVPKENSNKKSPTNANILGQFSPDLQAFIEQEIQSGKAPDHAAASAMPRAEFSDIIHKIEKQEKKKFTALVRELYEAKAVQQPERQAALQGQPQQAQQGLDPGVAQILQQGQALLQKFKGGM